jgi:hypothetical protein
MSSRHHLSKIRYSDGSGFTDARIVPLTPEIADFWHTHIQHHETDTVSKDWDWRKMLWWTAELEVAQGRKTIGIAVVAKTQQNIEVPVALMIVANGYPNVWDSTLKSFTNGSWVWYIQKAPISAMSAMGMANVSALRNCVDAAVIVSMQHGTHGRLMLNSSPKGGNELRKRYEHIMGLDALYLHTWRSTLRLKRKIGTLFAFNPFQAIRFVEHNRRNIN